MRCRSTLRRIVVVGLILSGCSPSDGADERSVAASADEAGAIAVDAGMGTDASKFDAAVTVDAGAAIDADSSDARDAGDAGTFCEPGAEVPCYEGPPGTDVWGICRKGTRRCAADGSTFGACTGQILPQTERCDTPDDDDCNGLINEAAAGCSCVPGAVVPCYPGPFATRDIGTCRAGTQTCLPSGLGYGACENAITPAPTDCASDLDLDCDGRTHDPEEGCCTPATLQPCYTGDPAQLNVGRCQAGRHWCNADGVTFGACTGDQLPMPEVCGDYIDNDCNGKTDESGANCTCSPYDKVECYSGPPATKNVGVCKSSFYSCPNGTYQVCWGEVTPAAHENCATTGDDDCDGSTSPGCMASDWLQNTLGSGELAAPLADGGIVLASMYQLERMDASGQLSWAKPFQNGFVNDERLAGIPGSSDVVIVQRCADTSGATIGNASVDCSTLGLFASRFDGDGDLVWTRRIAGEGITVTDFVADSNGNGYLLGTYASPNDLPGATLPTFAHRSAFLAKFDSVGQLVWARGYDGNAYASALGLTRYPDGVVFTGNVLAGTNLGSGGTAAADGLRVSQVTSAGDVGWTAFFEANVNTAVVRSSPLGGVRVLAFSYYGGAIGTTNFARSVLVSIGADGSLAGARALEDGTTMEMGADGSMFMVSSVGWGFEPEPRWSTASVVKLNDAGDAMATIPTTVLDLRLATSETGKLFLLGARNTPNRIGDEAGPYVGSSWFVQRRAQ